MSFTYFTAAFSDVKLKLYVYSFNLSECAKIYNRIGINLTNNKQLCAGAEGKGTCTGDSGAKIDFPTEIIIYYAILILLHSGGSLTVLEQSKENYEFVWYMIGVVSFGPKNWFVSLFYPFLYCLISMVPIIFYQSFI